MKKNIILVIIAISIGTLLAFYVFKKIDYVSATSNLNNKIVLYQVGAFNVYANAIEKSTIFPGSVIIEEDNMFKVFIAIAHSNKIINKYSEYLEEKNIDYYLKKTYLKDSCIDEIAKYEKLLEKSKDKDVYIKINSKLLKYYKDECYD